MHRENVKQLNNKASSETNLEEKKALLPVIVSIAS